MSAVTLGTHYYHGNLFIPNLLEGRASTSSTKKWYPNFISDILFFDQTLIWYPLQYLSLDFYSDIPFMKSYFNFFKEKLIKR